ncbi:TAXI family TRAP transporter solute-binding subunit [Salicibibacter cibarius]|uniref:TAXI family TRAP transporter solute-binding subunit n=1 Tax=Salicibibacter cibarius TaxID=2743000 RepID=A0A7T6Z5S3_9BACI|nr:TAXI family TRAP transporter solute-binding subunit [Salicibibacter cibarius]QQK77431.1 TAXI family TRAP transporter solute-binding subunit [Salicibibacter cibarius]
MKRISLVFNFIFLSVLLIACGEDSASSDDGNYVVTTGGTSGTLYSVGAAFSQTVNGSESSLNLTNQASGGAVENVRLMDSGDAQFSLFGGDMAQDAIDGMNDFEGESHEDMLKGVFSIYDQPLNMVTLEGSGIESFSDLEGQTVAVGSPGSGNEVRTRQVIESLGLTYDDINAEFLSIEEGVEGIRDGQVDASIVWTGLPTPGIMDLASLDDIHMIPLTSEEVDDVVSDFPALYEHTIPGGTYDGVEEDVQTVSVNVQFYTAADTPDEDVYSFMEIIFDNTEELENSVSTLEELSLETADEDVIDLHPGAERFFEENQ